MRQSVIKRALCGASFIVPSMSGSLVLATAATAQNATCSVTGTTATDQLVECVDSSIVTAAGTADLTTTITAGPGLVASSAGSQSITLSGPGSISTTGADAVQAISGGDINFDAVQTDFTITGDELWGTLFWATGATGDITVALGDVTTHGWNTWGVSVFGPGTLDLTVGDILTTGGQYSIGIEAFTDGSQTITCGNLTTTGHGILAGSSTGSVTVNCGAVSTTGSLGLYHGYHAVWILAGTSASVTTGPISTTGIDSVGLAISAGGNVNANVGAVSTLGDWSDGIQIFGADVDVQFADITTAGANAQGLKVAGSGAVTFNAAPGATISTTGTGSHGVLVQGAAVSGTVGNVSAANADAIVISSTGDASLTTEGNVSSATGAGVVITASGTASVTVGSGSTVEGATNGIQLHGSAGNVLTVNGTLRSSTSGNPAYTVSGGPLTLTIGPGGSISMMSLTGSGTGGSTGTIIGPLAFTEDDDTFNNAGTYSALGTTDFGEGADLFNNLVGGTMRAAGATTLAGLESFSNSGTIDLHNGAAGDSLSISGDFFGLSGSSLLLDAGAGVADRLTIGGHASGTTSIYVQGITTATTSPILLVSTGATTTDAFVLGSTSATRLIDLALTQVGTDYFLSAAPNALALQPRNIGRAARDSWYQSTGTFSYAGARRTSQTLRQGNLSLWSHMSGPDAGRLQPALVSGSSVGSETRRRSAQIGADFYPAGGKLVVGIAGGWQDIEAALGSAASVDMAGHHVGIYGQIGDDTGFFAGAVLSTSWSRARLSNAAFAGANPDVSSAGIEGEAGFRWSSRSSKVEVGARLAYVRTKIGDFSAEGIDYHFGTDRGVRASLGGRVNFSGTLAPFIDARLNHDLVGQGRMSLTSGSVVETIDGAGRRTWGRLEAGIGSPGGAGPMLAGWTELGDIKSLGLRAGIRF